MIDACPVPTPATLVFEGKCKYFSLTPAKPAPTLTITSGIAASSGSPFMSCLHRERSQDLQYHALQRETQTPAKSELQIRSQTGPGTDILPQREAVRPRWYTHPCTYTPTHRVPGPCHTGASLLCFGLDTSCNEGICMLGNYVHLWYSVLCVHHALSSPQVLTLCSCAPDAYLTNEIIFS